MSLHFANAPLAGCTPYAQVNGELAAFMRLLDEFEYGAYGFLQTLFGSVNVQSFWLHGADNDDYAQCIKTDDGKGYYAARMFVGQYGAFALLIPWSRDRKQKDGTTSDRLPQIHRFGNTDNLDIKRIIENLTVWLIAKKQEKIAMSA